MEFSELRTHFIKTGNPFTKMIKPISFISFLMITVLIGCSEPAETPTKGNLLVGVDESVYPLLQKEKDSFQSNYPESKIKLEKINLRDGIINFISGNYKMFISSRNFNKKELEFIENQKLYIRTFKFCFDGIAAITSKSSPLNKITFNELRDLFSGKLNGYTAVLPSANSGVCSFLRDSILSKLNNSNIKTENSEIDVINDIIKSKKEIGFVGLNSIRDSSEITMLKIGVHNNYSEIDYYQPHPGYFINNVYPLSRTIYIFLNETNLGLASGFTTYLTSYQGQKIVLSQNLAPAAVLVKLNPPISKSG
jgi:ABC-type phosphate transport system substrate-binding protein